MLSESINAFKISSCNAQDAVCQLDVKAAPPHPAETLPINDYQTGYKIGNFSNACYDLFYQDELLNILKGCYCNDITRTLDSSLTQSAVDVVCHLLSCKM